MTSRIQEDGAVGSEAKWADIDDDEDDWVPETIEWTDGTKVNLTQTHEPTPEPPIPPSVSQPEPKAVPPAGQIMSKELPKPAPKSTTSIGPNPTILKLGANAERQARTANAPNGADNLPSSSTSPAPPSKSPWAALPPVERVSPVNGPPVQAPHYQQRTPMRFSQRDDSFHPSGQIQPKEIAADDFNRTWKESQSAAPRELFNSRSGQYEPVTVTDTRRPSWRHDQHPNARAPAVLQRHGENPRGPAEPSAAFQTHRSSHQDGMGWGRRRTSSNVSGGSGGFGRRMSVSRHDAPPRMIDGRRASLVNGMVDPALMVPEQHHGKSEALPPPNGVAHQAAEGNGSVVPPVLSPASQFQELAEDPVVLQERIMKEKRLEARQRRDEEAQKEEAAKKERIRQRLEAMGPPPEKKAPETRIPPTPPSQPQQLPRQTQTSQVSPQPTHTISPPKPPVPEPTGAPKQYGMMKVHHPDSVKKLVGASDRPSDGKQHFARRVSSPHQEPSQPLAPAVTNKTAPRSPVEGKSIATKPEEQHGQQWQGKMKVSTSPWSHPNITTSPPVKNLWKALTTDRTHGLGNGIFDQPLALPPHEGSLRQLGLDQASMPATSNLVAPKEEVPSLPSPETRHASFGSLRPIGGPPGLIGPPAPNQSTGVEAWKSFARNAGERERGDQKNFMEHFHRTHQKGEHLTAPASFEQTWKKIKPDQDGKRIVTEVTHKVIGNELDPAPAVQLPNPLTSLDAPSDGLPSADPTSRRVGPVQARSSRFFPSATEQPKRQAVELERSSSSPPPPEEVSSHPVYFGDSSRPHVHLPIPKPVVKLPPKAVSAPAPPPTFASMAAAPPRHAIPPASTALSWQEKINSLFKSASTEKKNVFAVTPATKEALPVYTAAVSVSIPQTSLGSYRGDGDIAVEQVEKQDEMFEDREPGSLPAVRVPGMAPPNSWSKLPPLRHLRKNIKQIHAQSIQPFLVGLNDRDNHGNARATVLLPGAADPITFIIPRKFGPPRPRTNNATRSRQSNHKSGEVSGGGFKKSAASNPGPRQQSTQKSWSPVHSTSH